MGVLGEAALEESVPLKNEIVPRNDEHNACRASPGVLSETRPCARVTGAEVPAMARPVPPKAVPTPL